MFDSIIQMFTESPKVAIACVVMAFIPAGVYMWYFLRQEPEPKRIVFKTFIYGCLSVIPLSIIQYFMSKYPVYDVNDLISKNISNIYYINLATFVFVGLTEEYAKHWVVKIADEREKSFRTVADGIEFSIIAALGFAFIEHIVYFIGIVRLEGFDGLIQPFIYRSIFTTLAHVCFSGIYGYYYGRSHFMKSAVKRDMILARGLISAMILHAIFNFVLEVNLAVIVVPLLIMELGFILYEFNQSRNREVLIPYEDEEGI